MANTDSQDLEEKLSPWARKIGEQGQGEEHAHHSPRSSAALNEKLAQWGTSIDDQGGDPVHVSSTTHEEIHGERSPHRKRRSHHRDKEQEEDHGRQKEEHGRHSPSGVDQKYLDEKLSPWGRKVGEQDHSPRSHDELNEKLAQWGTSIDNPDGALDRTSPPIHEDIHEEIHVSAHGGRSQHHEKETEEHAPTGVDQGYLDEKLAAWGRKVEDEPMDQSSTGGDRLYDQITNVESTDVQFEFFTRKGLQERLMEWGINSETIEYPKALTEDEAELYISNLEGTFAKNILLHDKMMNLYLFCGPRDASITLGDLGKIIGATGELNLVSAKLLEDKLGLKEGLITALGLINDYRRDIKTVLDNRLMDGTYSKIHFYPMVTTATTALSPEGLRQFLKHTGHTPVVIDVSKGKLL